jgi:BirA family biotin operon repressor/biotin-[acetyl-CoA-carboxylase] ligase
MPKDSIYSRDSIRQELDKLGLSYVELSFFEEIASTNTELKRQYVASEIPKKATVFVAKRQSAGRGRLGRNFESPDAGIYMSVLLPEVKDGAVLTAYVAVMAAEALEEISGAAVEIKWVNDLYLSGRKLAGILCEGIINAESGKLEASVVGIGINVLKADFPKELSDIAISLEDATGKAYSRAEIAARIAAKIIKELPRRSPSQLIEKYKSKSNVLGKTVKVTRGNEAFFARAVDINEKAELIAIKENGEKTVLNSGEVSAKIKFDN